MQYVVLPSPLTAMPRCENCGGTASKILMESTGAIWATCSKCAVEWKPKSAIIAALAKEIE